MSPVESVSTRRDFFKKWTKVLFSLNCQSSRRSELFLNYPLTPLSREFHLIFFIQAGNNATFSFPVLELFLHNIGNFTGHLCLMNSDISLLSSVCKKKKLLFLFSCLKCSFTSLTWRISQRGLCFFLPSHHAERKDSPRVHNHFLRSIRQGTASKTQNSGFI